MSRAAEHVLERTAGYIEQMEQTIHGLRMANRKLEDLLVNEQLLASLAKIEHLNALTPMRERLEALERAQDRTAQIVTALALEAGLEGVGGGAAQAEQSVRQGRGNPLPASPDEGEETL